MAISAGDAIFYLKGDHKGLDKALSRSQSRIAKFSASAKKNLRRVGIGLAAIGAAGTAFALKATKDYAKAGDEIEKMSRRTGFAAKTLSELKHAAELSGASLEDIEKASKRFSSTLEDAKDGLETAERAFEKLGLSVKDFEGLSPEDAFLAVSYALADVEDATTRAAIAQDMFGRSGTQLLPMLEGGSEGIRKMREEADRLGITFDKQSAKQAADYQDAMLRLKRSLSSLEFAIGSALMPALQKLADRLGPMIQNIGEWIRQNRDLIATKVEEFVRKVGEAMYILFKTISNFVTEHPDFAKFIGKWGAAFAGVALVVTPLAPAIMAVNTAIKALIPLLTSLIPLIVAIDVATAPIWLTIGAAVAVGGAAYLLGRWLDKMIDKWLPGLGKAIDKIMDKIVGFINKIRELAHAIRALLHLEKGKPEWGERTRELIEKGLVPTYKNEALHIRPASRPIATPMNTRPQINIGRIEINNPSFGDRRQAQEIGRLLAQEIALRTV